MIIFTLIDVTKIDRNGRETMFGYKIIYTTRDVIIIQSGIDPSRKIHVNHTWHLLIRWNQSTYAMWVIETNNTYVNGVYILCVNLLINRIDSTYAHNERECKQWAKLPSLWMYDIIFSQLLCKSNIAFMRVIVSWRSQIRLSSRVSMNQSNNQCIWNVIHQSNAVQGEWNQLTWCMSTHAGRHMRITHNM